MEVWKLNIFPGNTSSTAPRLTGYIWIHDSSCAWQKIFKVDTDNTPRQRTFRLRMEKRL